MKHERGEWRAREYATDSVLKNRSKGKRDSGNVYRNEVGRDRSTRVGVPLTIGVDVGSLKVACFRTGSLAKVC